MFHPAELDFIHFVQQIRTPVLDYFFKFLNYFDRQEFFLILFPAIWFGVNWKAGLKVFYILIFNHFINHTLKVFFAHPRPFHVDPSVGLVDVGGYGFPSGAAQTVILLSGLMLCLWESRWKWVVASLYFFLISFSRLYLGVHFPSDILGGWTAGLSFLFLVLAIRPLEKRLEKLKPSILLILSLGVPLTACLVFGLEAATSGCLMGIGTGLYISHKNNLFPMPHINWIERFLRATVGILGTAAVYFLGPLLFSKENAVLWLIHSFILGLWLGLFANLFCRKILLNKLSDKRAA